MTEAQRLETALPQRGASGLGVRLALALVVACWAALVWLALDMAGWPARLAMPANAALLAAGVLRFPL